MYKIKNFIFLLLLSTILSINLYSANCNITEIKDVSFTNYTPYDNMDLVSVEGKVKFICDTDLSYNVDIGNGNYYIGNTRRMKHKNKSEYLNYDIKLSKYSGNATKDQVEEINLTTTIPRNQDVSIGSYSDTPAFVITY